MDADTAWVLVSAALVMFMVPGLALFYGGMVGTKNVLNMMNMNLYCLGIVPYFVGGGRLRVRLRRLELPPVRGL